MKTTVRLLFIFFAIVIFSGCPYNSEVPIDEPSVKIDDKLLGLWEAKSSSDYLYDVKNTDNFTYSIEKKSTESGDVTAYKGYLSDVEGVRFFNIWEESASPRVYYFYKVETSTSGARLTLAPVTENIDEKFNDSKSLKDFFKNHSTLSFFYSKEEDVYIKAD